MHPHRDCVVENQMKYNNCVDMVVKAIIRPNPGLFKKKVLVFIADEGDSHWTATFVFNPSCIIAEEAPNGDTLRCCYYQYCGLEQTGSSKVGLIHGIHWFLNLLYNHNSLSKANLSQKGEVVLGTETPFGAYETKKDGKLYKGKMSGTPFFPALRIEDHALLPAQKDGQP